MIFPTLCMPCNLNIKNGLRYETFSTFFKFRFSTQGERHTQFFSADCSSIVSFQLTDSTNAHAHPTVHNLTCLAQVRKINSLRLASNLNSLLFFKISKNPRPSLPDMTSSTSPFPIWFFYCDICDCYILPSRAWTPALMSAPTHVLSRMVLRLTKPKDEI